MTWIICTLAFGPEKILNQLKARLELASFWGCWYYSNDHIYHELKLDPLAELSVLSLSGHLPVMRGRDDAGLASAIISCSTHSAVCSPFGLFSSFYNRKTNSIWHGAWCQFNSLFSWGDTIMSSMFTGNFNIFCLLRHISGDLSF